MSKLKDFDKDIDAGKVIARNEATALTMSDKSCAVVRLLRFSQRLDDKSSYETDCPSPDSSDILFLAVASKEKIPADSRK